MPGHSFSVRTNAEIFSLKWHLTLIPQIFCGIYFHSLETETWRVFVPSLLFEPWDPPPFSLSVMDKIYRGPVCPGPARRRQASDSDWLLKQNKHSQKNKYQMCISIVTKHEAIGMYTSMQKHKFGNKNGIPCRSLKIRHGPLRPVSACDEQREALGWFSWGMGRRTRWNEVERDCWPVSSCDSPHPCTPS